MLLRSLTVSLLVAALSAGAIAGETVPPPPPALIEHAVRMSQFEQQQEAMRREIELMRTRLDLMRMQRDFQEQLDDLRLPAVVAVYRQGERAQALLRDESGVVFPVSLGQILGGGVRVARIDNNGVWVEVKRRGKRGRAEEIMLKHALTPQSYNGAPVNTGPAGTSVMLPPPSRLP